MLEERRIGAYISKLRKEQQMTQLELADELNVSHQAVSKWERGDSIPDIETLMKLSDLFEQTVDQLLYAGNVTNSSGGLEKIIKDTASDNIKGAAQVIDEDNIEMEEVLDIAPLIKPDDMTEMIDSLEDTDIPEEHWIALAPFIEEETLNKLVLQQQKTSMKTILSIAPFLEEETLWSFIDNEELDSTQIASLAPFLNQEKLNQFVTTNFNTMEKKELISLAPFFSSEQLMKWLELTEEPYDQDLLISLAPFLTQEDLNASIRNLDRDALTPKFLSSIAPFLNQKTIRDLLQTLSKTNV